MTIVVAIPLVVAVAVASLASAAERVVFCEKSARSCPEPNRLLGTSARGSWVLVDDRILLKNATGARALPCVLYFTIAEYQEAIAGLSLREREAAIRRRLEIVSSDAPVDPLGLVLADVRRVAAATRELDKDFLLILDAAIVLSGGANRVASFGSAVGPREALLEDMEALAPLLAEMDGDETARGYQHEAAILSKIASNLEGRPTRPPHASPMRAYFVAGVPAGPRSDPSFVDQPSYGWRGGSVQALSPADASSPPWKKSKPRLFYQARELFLEDITTLTPTQIDRRLRARLAGPPKRELSGWIATLAFNYTVSFRQYTEVVRQGKVPWLATWNEAAALDVQNLRRALAVAEPDAPAERRARIEKLRADLILAPALIRGAPQPDTYLGWLSEVATIVDRLQD